MLKIDQHFPTSLHSIYHKHKFDFLREPSCATKNWEQKDISRKAIVRWERCESNKKKEENQIVMLRGFLSRGIAPGNLYRK